MHRVVLSVSFCAALLAACPKEGPPAVAVVAPPLPDAAAPPRAQPPLAVDAGPLFEIKTIEHDDPASMIFELPDFHLGSPEIDRALDDLVTRDAAEAKRSFERMLSRSAPKNSTGWFYFWKCAPTLVRPALVSIRCSEHLGIGPGKDFPGDGGRHVLAIERVDGGVSLREVELRELFLRSARYAEPVVANIGDRTCQKALDARHVGAAIKGFTLAPDGVAFHVDMGALGCSPVPEDIYVPFSELEPMLDRTGVLARLAP